MIFDQYSSKLITSPVDLTTLVNKLQFLKKINIYF